MGRRDTPHSILSVTERSDLRVRCIPCLQDNYAFIVECRSSGLLFVIDPGDEIPVLGALGDDASNVRGVFLTHWHHDHTAGVKAVASHCRSPVHARAFSVSIGELVVSAIPTPGHTTDSICIVVNGDHSLPPIAFTGDSLFVGSCGALFEGDAATMHSSMQRLASQLPPLTPLYCGHEYSVVSLLWARRFHHDQRDDKAQEAADKTLHLARTQRRTLLPTIPTLLRDELDYNPFLRADSVKAFEQVLAAKNAAMAQLQ